MSKENRAVNSSHIYDDPEAVQAATSNELSPKELGILNPWGISKNTTKREIRNAVVVFLEDIRTTVDHAWSSLRTRLTKH